MCMSLLAAASHCSSVDERCGSPPITSPHAIATQCVVHGPEALASAECVLA
jgi:hypothetical protein